MNYLKNFWGKVKMGAAPVIKHRSKGETNTYAVLRKIYPRETIIKEKTFPDCLSPLGYRLRFDFYLAAKNIAIEYNGKQHYTYTPYFHKNENDFGSQVTRDNIKVNYCDQKGILLIVVPYNYVTEHQIYDYLITKLPKSSGIGQLFTNIYQYMTQWFFKK